MAAVPAVAPPTRASAAHATQRRPELRNPGPVPSWVPPSAPPRLLAASRAHLWSKLTNKSSILSGKLNLKLRSAIGDHLDRPAELVGQGIYEL